MSGPLPTEVARAAGELAIQAQARDAARNWAPRARAAATVAKRPNVESLPGRTWEAISAQVRCALVMLSLDTAGDPRTIARQPWESFNDSDRAALAATARQFRGELVNAACLW